MTFTQTCKLRDVLYPIAAMELFLDQLGVETIKIPLAFCSRVLVSLLEQFSAECKNQSQSQSL